MNKFTFSAIIGLATVGLWGEQALSAATMINWGPGTDIVTASQSLVGGGGSTAINLTSYNSPTVGVNYYPNATGKTPSFYNSRFYYEVTTANPGGITGSPIGQVGDIAANDRLNFSRNFNQAGTTVAQLHTITLWTQNEFMAGGNTAPSVTLNGMNIVSNDNGSSTTSSVRFVIRLNSSTYYVSQSYAEGTRSFSDPTAVSWFNYNPTSNFSLIGSAATLVAADFDYLTAAGFYFTTSPNNPSGAPTASVYATSFDVQATAVPEPSSYALFLGGLLGWVTLRHFRKAKA